MSADEIINHEKYHDHNPMDIYNNDYEIRKVLNQLVDGTYSYGDRELFRELYNSLLSNIGGQERSSLDKYIFTIFLRYIFTIKCLQRRQNLLKCKQKEGEAMLGKNIKYYRIQKGYSQQELADLIGVQKMTISNYENEKREPDVEMVKVICEVLGVSLNRFMAYKPLRSSEIVLNGSFRKNDNLSSLQEQKIIGQIQYALERYLEVADIIGTGCIGVIDSFEALPCINDFDENAIAMRRLLGFSEKGAISNLIQVLEDSNVFVVQINIDDSDFSGYSCWYNSIPIIAFNGTMNAERQRFTIAHELVHLLFDKKQKLSEKEVDDIAGRFLLPTEDCKRELGAKRKNLSTADIRFVQEEYGVSCGCVVYRAKQAGIINNEIYRKFSSCKIESGYTNETPRRFQQLVCRAYHEEEIGLSKVSELLDVSYAQAEALCS